MASPNPIPCAFVVKNASNMPSNCFGSIPGPEFFNCDGNCIATTMLSSHPQHPTSIRRGIHSFKCVVDQIKDDLLQLISVADDKWQFRRQFGASRNTMILQLTAQ